MLACKVYSSSHRIVTSHIGASHRHIVCLQPAGGVFALTRGSRDLFGAEPVFVPYSCQIRLCLVLPPSLPAFLPLSQSSRWLGVMSPGAGTHTEQAHHFYKKKLESPSRVHTKDSTPDKHQHLLQWTSFLLPVQSANAVDLSK